jgi:REP element-mobilizing transposase RayT
MNQYNPNKHHRKSIRLKGYDYSQVGLYFITICCQNRAHLFGTVINKQMILNDAGKMIEKWYVELENKFSDIKCHEMIVMPNHIHFIIENVGSVGADLRVCPNNSDKTATDKTATDKTATDKTATDLYKTNISETDLSVADKSVSEILGEHVGSPLHRVIQWFKTMTTNEYIRGVKNNNWQPFDGKLWQRNYWEHIIRNDKSYQKISEYIINNPSKWNDDTFYLE